MKTKQALSLVKKLSKSNYHDVDMPQHVWLSEDQQLSYNSQLCSLTVEELNFNINSGNYKIEDTERLFNLAKEEAGEATDAGVKLGHLNVNMTPIDTNKPEEWISFNSDNEVEYESDKLKSLLKSFKDTLSNTLKSKLVSEGGNLYAYDSTMFIKTGFQFPKGVLSYKMIDILISYLTLYRKDIVRVSRQNDSLVFSTIDSSLSLVCNSGLVDQAIVPYSNFEEFVNKEYNGSVSTSNLKGSVIRALDSKDNKWKFTAKSNRLETLSKTAHVDLIGNFDIDVSVNSQLLCRVLDLTKASEIQLSDTSFKLVGSECSAVLMATYTNR